MVTRPLGSGIKRERDVRPIVWPGLGSFFGRHGIRLVALQRATGMNWATLSNVLYGKTRDPRASTLDSILTFCRTFDADITHEQLFGERRERAAA